MSRAVEFTRGWFPLGAGILGEGYARPVAPGEFGRKEAPCPCDLGALPSLAGPGAKVASGESGERGTTRHPWIERALGHRKPQHLRKPAKLRNSTDGDDMPADRATRLQQEESPRISQFRSPDRFSQRHEDDRGDPRCAREGRLFILWRASLRRRRSTSKAWADA